MKVGEIVWFYDHHDKTIYNGTVIGVSGKTYLPDVIVPSCNVIVTKEYDNGDRDYINFTIPQEEAFSSREALCEHYRRIFE